MADLKNMKVEDRLAEKLKSADFGGWFGEDDLRELVIKALDIAFFQPVTTQKGYNTSTELPLVARIATEALNEKLNTLVLKALADRLAQDPSILEGVLAKVAERSFEDLLLKAIMRGLSGLFAQQEWQFQDRLRQALTPR